LGARHIWVTILTFPAMGYGNRMLAVLVICRDSLVQGKSFKAGKNLPKLNEKWDERYQRLKTRVNVSSDHTVLSILKKDSIAVSFNDETLVLRCPDKYRLSDKYLDGNIIITGTKILISNTCSIHRLYRFSRYYCCGQAI